MFLSKRPVPSCCNYFVFFFLRQSVHSLLPVLSSLRCCVLYICSFIFFFNVNLTTDHKCWREAEEGGVLQEGSFCFLFVTVSCVSDHRLPVCRIVPLTRPSATLQVEFLELTQKIVWIVLISTCRHGTVCVLSIYSHIICCISVRIHYYQVPLCFFFPVVNLFMVTPQSAVFSLFKCTFITVAVNIFIPNTWT